MLQQPRNKHRLPHNSHSTLLLCQARVEELPAPGDYDTVRGTQRQGPAYTIGALPPPTAREPPDSPGGWWV